MLLSGVAVCTLGLSVGMAAIVHLGYAAQVAMVCLEVGVCSGVGCREGECRWCCGLLRKSSSNMVAAGLLGWLAGVSEWHCGQLFACRVAAWLVSPSPVRCLLVRFAWAAHSSLKQ